MRIGYVSVAVDEAPDAQIAALRAAGVATADIHVDTVPTGARAAERAPRPALERIRAAAGPGDVLTVTGLHRLAAGLRPLVALGAGLREAGMGLRVLDDGIDTDTDEGRAQFDMLVKLDGFQRGRIASGTRAGLTAARAEGRTGGRPAKLAAEQKAHAQQLYDQGGHTVAEIAKILRVGRATVYGYLDKGSVGKRPRARRSTTGPATTGTPESASPAPQLPDEPQTPPAAVAVSAVLPAEALAGAEVPPPRRLPAPPTLARREAFGRKRFRRLEPCPRCRTRPGRDYDPRQLLDDLAWSWLEADTAPDNPGGMVVAHHCAKCQPAQKFPIECAHPLCEHGPILGGELAAATITAGGALPELVYLWLTRHGWRDTAAGLVCPDHP